MNRLSRIILVSFMLVNIKLLAQTSFGVKASVNVNRLSGSFKAQSGNPLGNEKIQSTSIGWSAGVYASTNLSNKFFFIPELQFIRRYYTNIFYCEVQSGYVQLNSLLSYKPWKSIALEGGSYYGRRILFSTNAPYARHHANIGFNRKNEIGIAAGVRVDVAKSLAVTTRYVFALWPVANKILYDDADDPWLFKAHNNSAELAVVYKIR
jgi:hypothetical protein